MINFDAPLSFPQEQLWLVESLAPGTYNEVWVLRIKGELAVGLLQQSLNVVVNRHEVLRSTYHIADGEPVCRPLPELSIQLADPVDLSAVPEPMQPELIEGLAAMVADPPYDMAAGPLIRASLAILSVQEHVLVLAMHHIVADGWSLRVVLSELLTAYQDLVAGLPISLAELPLQYRDFAIRQRAQQAELEFEREYWREQLADAVPVLELRPGQLRPLIKGVSGRRICIDLPSDLGQKIHRFALGERGTVASVLLTAFAAVVHRYTDRDDFLIGTATPARPDEDLEGLVGFFANTVPLRIKVKRGQTFRRLMREVMSVSLDALDNDRLPFARIVDLVRPGRDPSYNPLVQVVFSHTHTPDNALAGGGLEVSYEHVPRTRSRFDLIVEAQTSPGAVHIWLEFDDVLLPESYVRQMFVHLQNLLSAALIEPDTAISDLAMLTAQERAHAAFEEPPAGLPKPSREVVVIGEDSLAPNGVQGRVVSVNPEHLSLVNDRLMIAGGVALPARGDRGYLDPDGTIVRLGPMERAPQLKGALVPLDLVAAALAVHPAVRSASVQIAGSPPSLCARVVTAPHHQTSVALLHDHLARRLPRYAIPRTIVVESAISGPGEELATSASAFEDWMLRTWQDAMAADALGTDDDFFAFGGHSVLAASIVLRIREFLGVEVPIRWIFEHPTVRQLAGRIAAERPKELAAIAAPGGAAIALASPAPFSAAAPLTAAQRQIWVLDRLAPGRSTYHSPIRVDIRGNLDSAAMERAVAAVVARHDALRCAIRFDTDSPMQSVMEDGPKLAVLEMAGLPGKQREAELERLARDLAHKPFDLASQPGIRAVLVPGYEDVPHVFFLTVHHVLMDGVGFQVFCRDLCEFYNAEVTGSEPALEQVDMSWMDYARWEHEWLIGPEPAGYRAYWAEKLRDLPVLELPTSHQRPSVLTFDGDQISAALDADTTSTIRQLIQHAQVSPFAALTAAQAALVNGLTGAVDIPIGAVGDNRRLLASSRLIGCTISTLVLRVDASGDPSFADLLSRVQATALEAYTHQGLPFTDLVRAAAMPRRTDRLPLFQVATEWQGADQSPWNIDGCAVSWHYSKVDTARNDLYLTGSLRNEELVLELEYNTNLWSAADAHQLLDALRGILTAAAANPQVRLSELPVASAALSKV